MMKLNDDVDQVATVQNSLTNHEINRFAKMQIISNNFITTQI